jgi:hypothetical protein
VSLEYLGYLRLYTNRGCFIKTFSLRTRAEKIIS